VEFLFLLGRILYAMIFIMSGFGHLTRTKAMAEYAKSKGVPAPGLATVGTGILILLGGLSILLGYQPQVGAVLLIIFLVPTSLMMHNFWAVKDQMQKQLEMVNFLKNIAMTGAALLFLNISQWPLSLGQ